MANGGAALGRDEQKRVIFVPQAIMGERVEVELVEEKKRFAHAEKHEA
jgi:tRNA/tmRNA/rRNA uracil-C5-methylase (TrmA/RlmC/RlmD family)